MTHSEIYTKFMIEYDKANVTSSYPSLTKFEIATLLDKAYLALIALKLTGNNTRKIGFEGDTKAVKDLEPLVVHQSLSEGDSTLLAENEKVYELSDDLLYYLYSNIIYIVKPRTYNRNFSIPHKMLIGTKLITHEYADNFRYSSINKPWIKNPVCYLEEGNVHVLYDPEKHYLSNTDSRYSRTYMFYNTYIKKPNSFVVDDTTITTYETDSISQTKTIDYTALTVVFHITGLIITTGKNEVISTKEEDIVFTKDIPENETDHNIIYRFGKMWNGINITYTITQTVNPDNASGEDIPITETITKPTISVVISSDNQSAIATITNVLNDENKYIISYTIDGSDPSYTNGSKVSEKGYNDTVTVNIDESCTIKAVIISLDDTSKISDISSYDVSVITPDPEPDPDPDPTPVTETITPPTITYVYNALMDDYTVTITNVHDGDGLYYIGYTIDGTTPSILHCTLEEQDGCTFFTQGCTIKAITIDASTIDEGDDGNYSEVTTVVIPYLYRSPDDPTIDIVMLSNDTIAKVIITNSTLDERSYMLIYTIDGTTPSLTNGINAGGINYNEKITFNVTTSCTVKAIFILENDSSVQSGITSKNIIIKKDEKDPTSEEDTGDLDETKTTYSITVLAGDRYGNVSGGGVNLEYGSSCTLIATPNTNTSEYIYSFVNWTKDGEIISTESTLVIMVTGNATYVAHFSQTAISIPKYTVTVTTGNSYGTVSGGGIYEEGSQHTITATPNASDDNYTYTFEKWTENGLDSNKTASFILTVNRDVTYVAYFTRTKKKSDTNYDAYVIPQIKGNGTTHTIIPIIYFKDEDHIDTVATIHYISNSITYDYTRSYPSGKAYGNLACDDGKYEDGATGFLMADADWNFELTVTLSNGLTCYVDKRTDGTWNTTTYPPTFTANS